MLTVNCDNCGRKVSVVDLVAAWDEKVCLVCVSKLDGHGRTRTDTDQQAESGRMPVAGVEVYDALGEELAKALLGVEVLPQTERRRAINRAVGEQLRLIQQLRRRHRKAMRLLRDMQSWYRDYPYLDEGLSGMMCQVDELLAEVAE